MDKLRSKILPLILVMVLLGAGFAVFSASSPAVASGAFGWQTWSTGGITWGNGSPYWNHGSWDGGTQNVGEILSGANGDTNLVPPPGVMPYWGNFTGTADPDIFFSSSVVNGGILFGSSGKIEVKVVRAGNWETNVFGWYDVANPSILNPLLIGKDVGATVTFTPSAKFGLYFIGYNGGDTWYSNATLNGGAGEQSDQHFAIFEGSYGNLWVGCEDLSFSGSDRDYQDLVVEMMPTSSSPPLPEASTIVMFSLGLVVLGGFVGYGIHRRRATA